MNKPQKKSIKKNFIFNLIYQVILVIVPIITTPYVSRVLHSYGIGQYSFSYSITSYFVVFANFGFFLYAQREIAKYQDNREKQTKLFYEIFILKFLITLVAITTYFGIINLSIFNEYKILLYILSPLIISVGFDISFLLTGNENFEALASINSLIKITSLVLIFIFVKKESDLWIYTLLGSASSFIAATIYIFIARKYLVKIDFKTLNFKQHFVPALKLFIPTVAITVYSAIDRTMLGFIIKGKQEVVSEFGVVEKNISDIEIGNYDQAERIIKLVNAVFYAFGNVLIPRNSYYYKNGMMKELRDNIYKSMKFCYFLALPAMFGIISIAYNFSPWFYGDGYDKVPLLLSLFSPFFIFAGMNFIFGNQYLVVINKDNVYTTSVIIGAISNVILNLLLIEKFMAVGSAIASVSAELIVLIYQLSYLKKEFPLKDIIKPIIKYFDASLIMFFVTYTLSQYLVSSIINTVIIAASGILVYFGLLLLFKEEFTIQFSKKAIGFLKKKH